MRKNLEKRIVKLEAVQSIIQATTQQTDQEKREEEQFEAYLESHPEDAAAFHRIMAKTDDSLGPEYLFRDLTDEELHELRAILVRVPDPDSAIP